MKRNLEKLAGTRIGKSFASKGLKKQMGTEIRVGSGFLRGRSLRSPRTELTHPMGAREKLALFNMLGDLTGVRILDAYAGTGALGIEALSRGADKVVFVEKNPGVAKVLKGNLAEMGLTGVGEVRIESVGKFVIEMTERIREAKTEIGKEKSQKNEKMSYLSDKQKFGMILADPPYDKFDITEVAGLAKLLENGGVLALSHPEETPELPDLRLLKTKKYAGARISLYQNIEK